MSFPKLILAYSVIFCAVNFGFAFCQTVDLSKDPVTTEDYNLLTEFIKKNAPSEDAFVAMQRILAPKIKTRNWLMSISVLKSYKHYFPNMSVRIEKLKSLLEEKTERIRIKNLGPGINTKAPEYCPVPTADGQILYFTRVIQKENKSNEDIFVSYLKDTVWTEADRLSDDINTMNSESICSISTDGNTLILYGTYKEKFGMGDNYYSVKTKKGWDKIKIFPKPVNSVYFDSDAFLTNNNNAILFISDRPGAIGKFRLKPTIRTLENMFHGAYNGNTDIYVCLKTDTGWSNPVNLGETINTPFCERTPFLHPDGRTLYFSSDGHYGIGKLDMFVSYRINPDSWTEWSEPVNLGKEINTAEDDWGYMVSTKGDIAYFSSDIRKDGYGNSDIFQVTLPSKLRPDKVAIIKGKITDSKGYPVEIELSWEDIEKYEILGKSKTDPMTGNYNITLPYGKKYGIYTSDTNYFPVSKNYDVTDTTGFSKKWKIENQNYFVYTFQELKEKGFSVILNNILFDFNKTIPRSESMSEITRVADIIKRNPDMLVEISGHTDNIGSHDYNINLSKKRAEYVVNSLVSLGCDKNNLKAEGYGEMYPVADNNTETGRLLNRRVEFRFVK
ncbi:MAG: OmpA family protein [Ignavibacteria bacterium]|nr:OmpA family protein [Ignavibacteria bacterium]